MKKIIFFFALFLSFTACSVLNKDMENLNKDENETITLLMTCEPENVSGFSACNRYFGKFTYKKGKLIFKDMASTAMMCPNQTMDLERRYLMQLDKVNNFMVDEDGQLLLRKDEKVLLIFAQ